MIITSRHNPKIQQLRGLLARRQEREKSSSFVVEGVRLVEEALAAGWKPLQVLYASNLSARGRELLDKFKPYQVDADEVSPELMDFVSDTETSQGILAAFASRELPIPARLDFVLVADAIHDPGNLGTLLRSAAAAGVQAVYLTPGTVDAFSPKVLRAGMGAHFRLPMMALDWEEISLACSQRQPPLRILLAGAGQGHSLWDENLRSPLALVVGSEAEGITEQAVQAAQGWVHIPMPGQSESLNAAVAASVILFEVVRQRKLD